MNILPMCAGDDGWTTLYKPIKFLWYPQKKVKPNNLLERCYLRIFYLVLKEFFALQSLNFLK